MKTLQESLFDKDIVEKDMTIGSMYEVEDVYVVDSDYVNSGQSYRNDKDDYKWLDNILKTPQLSKKFGRVKLNKSDFGRDYVYVKGWVPSQDFLDLLGYLIAAIYSAPLIYKNNTNVLDIDNIKNTILPYLKDFNNTRTRRGGGPSSTPKYISMRTDKVHQIITITHGSTWDNYMTLTIYLKEK